MDNKEYHERNELGSTDLKYLLKSVKHFIDYKQSEQKETPAMLFGTLVHALVLEPKTVKDNYAAPFKAPEGSISTVPELKIYVEQNDLHEKPKGLKKDELISLISELKPDAPVVEILKSKHEKENEGKILLDEKTASEAKEMYKAIRSHPIAQILNNGQSEVSMFGEISGVPVKARPDYLNQSVIVDLKTCKDASPNGFVKAACELNYYLSAALYMEIVKQNTGLELPFLFLAAEKGTNYISSYVVDWGSDAYNHGITQASQAIEKYKQWKEGKKTMEKYAYEQRPLPLHVPSWEFSKTKSTEGK